MSDDSENKPAKLTIMPSMAHVPFNYEDILQFFEDVLDRNGDSAFSDFAVVLADIAEGMAHVMLSNARFSQAQKMALAARHFKRAAKLSQELDFELRPAQPLDPSAYRKED